MSMPSAVLRRTRSGLPTSSNSRRCGKRSSRPRFDSRSPLHALVAEWCLGTPCILFVIPANAGTHRSGAGADEPWTLASAGAKFVFCCESHGARPVTAQTKGAPTSRKRSVRDILLLGPRIVLIGLLALAIADMIVGVFLRYVMVPV